MADTEKQIECPDCGGYKNLKAQCTRCNKTGSITVKSMSAPSSTFWPEGLTKADWWDKS